MLATIKAIFSALGEFFGLLNTQTLINAGEDKQARKNADKVIDNVKLANDARRDPDKLDRVRDKYERK